MKSFASRCLSMVALALLLAACQSAPSSDLAGAFHQLEQNLAADQLAEAENRLLALRQRAGADPRLEQYQRQLAEAYLQRGQQALQAGDLDTAAKALGQARGLMPQAPALTTGLEGAIGLAREAESTATERPAWLIDPAAASSTVPLPMLDSRDNQALYRLLDAVAADVVNFRCSTRIQVRQASDYLWLAALLSARIKRLDPDFSPRLSQAIEPQQTPQLVLSPQRRD